MRISDWSSDVCSSDLQRSTVLRQAQHERVLMMTDLTNLTVAQIRDGHRAGEFSAVEVAEAFNAHVAGAKALNAFIVETPEHALAAATTADAARAAGTDRKSTSVNSSHYSAPRMTSSA